MMVTVRIRHASKDDELVVQLPAAPSLGELVHVCVPQFITATDQGLREYRVMEREFYGSLAHHKLEGPHVWLRVKELSRR